MNSDNPEQNPGNDPEPEQQAAQGPENTRDARNFGCLGLIFEIGSWVFSTFMITAGVFLLLFGVLDFSPEARLRTVILLLFVPVAIFVLLRIGRSILDDLRGR
ncbi:MAG: hypothetical protein ACR2KW_10460 [Rubrobacter sp.]